MATYSPSKITKDGNTYNFTDDTKIPLSGTSALSGSIVPDTDDAYSLGSDGYTYNSVHSSLFVGLPNMNFGLNYGRGGYIICRGANVPPVAGVAGQVSLFPWVSDSNYQEMNLFPNGTWTWSGSACVVGSDRRIKDEIESIPDEILDAWENLEPKQYKLKSDLENDKDNAQTHYGWIAQDVESVIKGDRKAEVKNGLWLHETWEEQEEVSHEETYTEEVQTKSGETETVTKTRKVIDTPYRAKGDSYGLRYTECLVVECAYLRKKNKELQAQLDKLSARLDKLEKGKEEEK